MFTLFTIFKFYNQNIINVVLLNLIINCSYSFIHKLFTTRSQFNHSCIFTTLNPWNICSLRSHDPPLLKGSPPTRLTWKKCYVSVSKALCWWIGVNIVPTAGGNQYVYPSTGELGVKIDLEHAPRILWENMREVNMLHGHNLPNILKLVMDVNVVHTPLTSQHFKFSYRG